jgi:hypothetical protein
MNNLMYIFGGVLGFFIGFFVIPKDNGISKYIQDEPTIDSCVSVVHESPETKQFPDSLMTLVDAMIQVESSGNHCAYNKREDAVGCLQIRPIMVREVNRLLGREEYTMNDRWDYTKSLEMFLVVVEHHHPDGSFEGIARCWNGGPNGMRMESTKTYWEKVLSRIGSS